MSSLGRKFYFSRGKCLRGKTARRVREVYYGHWVLGGGNHLPSRLALLASQPIANSAYYRQRDRKLVVAYGLRGLGHVWLTGTVVCLRAAPRVHCSLAGQWMVA